MHSSPCCKVRDPTKVPRIVSITFMNATVIIIIIIMLMEETCAHSPGGWILYQSHWADGKKTINVIEPQPRAALSLPFICHGPRCRLSC